MQAEQLYRGALTIRQSLLGPKHLLVASTLFHLGEMLSCLSASHNIYILSGCLLEIVKLDMGPQKFRIGKLGPKYVLGIGNLELKNLK